MKKILASLLALGLFACAGASPALAQESNGNITIPIKEYEKLKSATEAKKDKQYWNMTFEQILDEENGDVEDAWELYRYYVLRELDVDGPITSVSDVISDMNVLSEIDSEKPVTLVITSPGGSVYSGFELYNAMMTLDAPVNTVCDGMAASMAAVLLVAGDHRTATPACHWMIHEVGGGVRMQGQTTDFIKLADYITHMENILLEIVSENTGLSMSDVRKLGEYETFYNSEEILRLGVVDEVISDKPRDVPRGSRALPEDLLPINRMKKNLSDKLDGQ